MTTKKPKRARRTTTLRPGARVVARYEQSGDDVVEIGTVDRHCRGCAVVWMKRVALLTRPVGADTDLYEREEGWPAGPVALEERFVRRLTPRVTAELQALGLDVIQWRWAPDDAGLKSGWPEY